MIAELQGRAADLETEVQESRQQAQEGQEKLLHMKAACEEHELTISSMRALMMALGEEDAQVSMRALGEEDAQGDAQE